MESAVPCTTEDTFLLAFDALFFITPTPAGEFYSLRLIEGGLKDRVER